MPPKSETIAIKTYPIVKKKLERVAKKEFRTLSQQVEMILVQYLRQNGHLDPNADLDDDESQSHFTDFMEMDTPKPSPE